MLVFIAFKAALFDVTFDIALFIVAKYCCQIIYQEHMRIDSSQFYIPLELFFPLFHIVLLLLILEGIPANATHKEVDFLIYSLKFIAGVAAVFTITTNISSIHNNLFTK